MELCPGKAKPVPVKVTGFEDAELRRQGYGGHCPPDALSELRGQPIPKIKIRCELCGRKVQARVRTCHDGCCTVHFIPPHNPKGWWKKPKKKSKDRRIKRR